MTKWLLFFSLSPHSNLQIYGIANIYFFRDLILQHQLERQLPWWATVEVEKVLSFLYWRGIYRSHSNLFSLKGHPLSSFPHLLPPLFPPLFSPLINIRFYDPAQGGIFLDGTDIKTLDLKFLRSQISLVSQVFFYTYK